jgi:hypothetical protein
MRFIGRAHGVRLPGGTCTAHRGCLREGCTCAGWDALVRLLRHSIRARAHIGRCRWSRDASCISSMHVRCDGLPRAQVAPLQEMPNLADLFFLHSLLLALAFHPPGWGQVSDSGTIAKRRRATSAGVIQASLSHTRRWGTPALDAASSRT